MKRILTIILFTCIIFSFSGCGHVSTYQSPKILNQGERLWGTGISLNNNEDLKNSLPTGFLSDLSIYTRYGLSDRAENGYKISFSLPFLSTSYHYKYLLSQTKPVKSMKNPLLVSGDLGFAIGLAVSGLPVFGFNPTLLFGREEFYGGVSTNIYFPAFLSSRVFMGASMGDDKWKFKPEISYDFLPHSGETVHILHGETTLPAGMIVVGFSIQQIFDKEGELTRKVARNERLRNIKKKIGTSRSKKNYPSIVDKTFSLHSGFIGSARGIGQTGFSKDLLITENIGVYFSGGIGTPFSSTHMIYGVGNFFQSHYNDNGWNIASVLGMAEIGGIFINTLINYQWRIGNSGLLSLGFIRGEFFNKNPQYHITEYPYGTPIISYNLRF